MFGLAHLGARKSTRKKRPYVPPAIVAEIPFGLLESLSHLGHAAGAAADTDGEPCDPIEYARSRMPTQAWSHCPHLGLDMQPDVVELWPSQMHSCFAAGKTDDEGQPVGEPVPLEHQAAVCLRRDKQRYCPRFLQALLRDFMAHQTPVPSGQGSVTSSFEKFEQLEKGQ